MTDATTARLIPTFAEHMADHDRFHAIAEQILDLHYKSPAALAHLKRVPELEKFSMGTRGDRAYIYWIIRWPGGECDRGNFFVPPAWFDDFDPAAIQAFLQEAAEKMAREIEAAEAEAKRREQDLRDTIAKAELGNAIAIVRAAGFEVHLPLKND